jgi:hypothetical protein
MSPKLVSSPKKFPFVNCLISQIQEFINIDYTNTCFKCSESVLCRSIRHIWNKILKLCKKHLKDAIFIWDLMRVGRFLHNKFRLIQFGHIAKLSKILYSYKPYCQSRSYRSGDLLEIMNNWACITTSLKKKSQII